MYEQYYGLSARPFQLIPDPKFFYRSQGHKRAMAYMRYGLQQGQGFIVVTGDVGTGKTMLVNNLFKEIENENITAAKIVSTNIKDVDLLRLLSAEFDIPYERQSKGALLKQLETYFKSCVAEGKRTLLVIDEAQNLSRSALEELRMLSNYDLNGQPVVQSFLLGQREFRAVMRAPGLEQLRQRVIAAYHLKPLSPPEVKAYIQHRLATVGWKGDPAIAEDAYHSVYVATGGVPRRINTLMDRVMLNCFLDEKHEITVPMVEAVRSEVEAEQGDQNDLSDPQIRPESWSRPIGEDVMATTQAVAAAAPREDVSKLEDKINQMQLTIEALTSRLQEARSVPSAPQHQISEPPDKGFPLWTTTFFSVVAVIVVIAVTIAGYLYSRH
ncbi:MAG: AAA family ATPase [Gammaproteobacteria bacterium]|nr:AAA family ATPase [Gammaproteobacteria bacterium]MBI5618913.1 AAA family ATPase [Gammaproteobacteria bacterium]